MSGNNFLDNSKILEDRITHLLSEWLNDKAPLGQEAYRRPAKAVIQEISGFLKQAKKR